MVSCYFQCSLLSWMKVSCSYSDTNTCKLYTVSFCGHHQVAYMYNKHGFSLETQSPVFFLKSFSMEMEVEAFHPEISEDVASFDFDQTG